MKNFLNKYIYFYLLIGLLFDQPVMASPQCPRWFSALGGQVGELKRSLRQGIAELSPTTQLRHNLFKTDRMLHGQERSYDRELLGLLLPRLQAMGPQQHWVDMGAGQGRALYQYMMDPFFQRKARITAIAFKKPNKALDKELDAVAPTFRYLEGAVEKMSSAKIGATDLITDVYGPLHYTKSLDTVLQVYVDALKKGGEILTNGFQYDRGATNFNGVNMGPGRMIPLRDWLEKIPGLQVTEVDVDNGSEIVTALVVKKTEDQVKIPELKLVSFRSSMPPSRIFQDPSP